MKNNNHLIKENMYIPKADIPNVIDEIEQICKLTKNDF
jgi:hypothetical protein